MAKFINIVKISAMNGEYEDTVRGETDDLNAYNEKVKVARDKYTTQLKDSKILPRNLSDKAISTAYIMAYNIVGNSPSMHNVHKYAEAFELISKLIEESKE